MDLKIIKELQLVVNQLQNLIYQLLLVLNSFLMAIQMVFLFFND